MPARVAPRAPIEGNPARLAGSIRRTTAVKMTWEPPGLVLEGTARDLLTTTEGARVLADARVRAAVEGWRTLVSLELAPDRAEAQQLLGSHVGSGFRAQIRQTVPGEEGTPLGLLLDDLPGSALISGYVHMRSDAHAGRSPGASTPPGALERMQDICSGWRRGGTAMASVAAGDGVPMQDCPPAPDLDHGPDPLAWHPVEALPVGAMRRRRRIDVSGVDPVEVDAMFRDSYGEPDGSEVVLHEYSLRATLSPVPELEIRSIEATPGVLPFWECPLAADNVSDLIGIPVGDLRREVPERLRGPRSCTHLNDLLRVLADVAALAPLVPAGELG